MQNLIREDIAKERLARLQALINEQQLAFNKSTIGRTLPVLIERKGKKDGQLSGRSPYFQSVNIQGNERLIDTIVDVHITDGFANSLAGDVVVQERISKAS